MTANLSERHREELRSSGLTAATIEAAGIRTVGSAEVKAALGWAPRGVDWGDAMLFPYSANGDGYGRVKPDYPRTNRDGHVVKYEAPRGVKNRAYFPPGVREQIESAVTIMVTEGEKKSLCVSQYGIPCVGIPGVWAWQRKRQRSDSGQAFGKRRLIDGLSGIPWKGKRVIIAFDSDVVTNDAVQLAEARLSETLTGEGGTVLVLRIPSSGDGKTGIDDYLVIRDDPTEALRKLIDDAQPAELPPTPKPMGWARMVIDELHAAPEGPTLRWYRDEFHKSDGTKYRVVPAAELVATLLQYLDERGGNAKPAHARDVLACMGSEVRVPFDIEQPAYLGRSRAPNLIAMANGLVDLDDALAGKGKVNPHTPRWFSPFALPYPFDPNAECPTWFETLDQLFDGDVERVNLLSEWFGYCLTDDTRHHAIMLMEGPPRSGKGTTLRALERVAGPDNCVAPRLSALGERFGLWSLIGKRVAICPDAHLGHGDRAMGVLEVLKSVSGEDSIDIDRKNLPPITTRLRTRFVLAVNELPRFGDNANALESRVLILPFRQSFVGREDRQLDEKLEPESPGIFRWSLEGLARLRKQGRFTQPRASADIMAEFATLTSPIRAFVEDRCIIDPAASVDRDELWAAWCLWCKASGHLEGSRNLLGTRLRSQVPTIRRSQPRGSDGKQVSRYAGIGLLEV